MSGQQGGWYGFDLDGTMAIYEGWKGVDHIGAPIAPVIAKLKDMIAEGKDCRVFTARVWPLGVEKPADKTEQDWIKLIMSAKVAAAFINGWVAEHVGVVIPLTCIKDFNMVWLMDDRLIQVVCNEGRRADGLPL